MNTESLIANTGRAFSYGALALLVWSESGPMTALAIVALAVDVSLINEWSTQAQRFLKYITDQLTHEGYSGGR